MKKTDKFDVWLSDGGETIGLIVVPGVDAISRNPVRASSLKTTSGNQSHSDMEPPYMAVAQTGFTGGRGAAEFEKDVTRYADGLRVNTERDSGVILAGRERYVDDFRAEARLLPGAMKMVSLLGEQYLLAKKFTTGNAIDVVHIWLWLRRMGSPDDLTISLRADASGKPSHIALESVTVGSDDLEELVSELIVATISTESLSAGTDYWVVAHGDLDSNANNRWDVGVLDEAGTSMKNPTGSNLAWAAADVDLYFRVTEDDADFGGHWFNFKKCKYFMSKPRDGSASKLYLNGARGLGASNAGNLDKLITSAAHGVSADDATGCVVMVVEGTGSTEEKNWRTVTGVPAADQFSVDSDWLIEHDATTVWVLLGGNFMEEIDVSSYITAPVTDVYVSSEEVVYFCQGAEDNIVRMKEEVSGGAWVRTIADDGTNEALFLTEYKNGTTQKIVRARTDGQVDECALPGWSNLISFNTAVRPGRSYDRVTGVQPYKDYDLEDAVVIFKEEGPWFYKNGAVDELRTPEMAAIASYKNGLSSAVHGSYLFFSQQNTVWRFYNPEFSDIGPTGDEGLPTLRQGNVTSIVPYPGKTYISVDGGDSGYSAIFSSSGSSNWTELYRAPKGERILSMSFQMVPGTLPDRLWFSQGADLVWLPFPSETYDPYHDVLYPFAHEMMLEFASISAGLYDAWKYWRSVKLRTENLSDGVTWFEVDWRSSKDDDWTPLPDEFIESPVESKEFGEHGVSCQVLYIRLRGYSTSLYETPKLTAAVLSGVTVVEPKFTYQFTAQILLKDLKGKKVETAPYKRVQRLDAWCGTAKPLKMYSHNPLYDDIKVFLMPLPVRPINSAEKVNEFEYQLNMVLQDA